MITKKKLMAFNYFGGKSLYLDFIISKLYPGKHYVETHCGSAVVFLNKPKLSNQFETINDIDGDVTNFFEVLRDHTVELVDKLSLTPYSRSEFIKACKPVKNKIERARRYFVRVKQSYGGLGSQTRINAWRIGLNETRNSISAEVSKYITSIQGLKNVALRLMDAQIENRPVLEIIEKYDSSDTIFYVDPPYLYESRTTKGIGDYKHEYKENDHIELAELLHKIKGKTAISGYDCKTMNELYGDFYKSIGPPKKTNLAKTISREILWTNYDSSNIHNYNLFK